MDRVLVVSSVHPPDDPRIRQKLVETLRTEMRVDLAVKAPGPSDATGIGVQLLRGGRLLRTMHASWKIVRGTFDVVSIHDPELLPAAIAAAALGREVVFDVHEDVPAQIRHKERIPALIRPLLAWWAALLLRVAERMVSVTLAEPGYHSLFAERHPVFPNTLGSDLPERTPVEQRSGLVYLGDITRQRGIDLAVEAAGRLDPRPRLTLIGRCADGFRSELEAAARRVGVGVYFASYLPHREALQLMGQHRIGLSPLLDVPNYRHSLPTKLLEYLAMGLPVVASDLPGGKAELGDEPGVEWVLAGDVRAMADGIQRLLDAPKRFAEAEAAAESIRARFRWPTDEVAAFYTATAESA